MTKNIIFKFRVGEAAKDKWTALAANENIPLAEFIRRAVDAFITDRKVTTAEEIAALYNLAEQLRRIGVNLNSLLTKLNSMESVEGLPAKVTGVVDTLQPLLNDTRKLIRKGMGDE